MILEYLLDTTDESGGARPTSHEERVDRLEQMLVSYVRQMAVEL